MPTFCFLTPVTDQHAVCALSCHVREKGAGPRKGQTTAVFLHL